MPRKKQKKFDPLEPIETRDVTELEFIPIRFSWETWIKKPENKRPQIKLFVGKNWVIFQWHKQAQCPALFYKFTDKKVGEYRHEWHWGASAVQIARDLGMLYPSN